MNKNRVCEMNIFSVHDGPHKTYLILRKPVHLLRYLVYQRCLTPMTRRNPLQRYEKKMKVTKKLVIKLLLI